MQSEQYQLASSAAYTVLSGNPDHARMKANVDFYMSLPEVMPSYFVDLEAKPYQVCEVLCLFATLST